MLGCDWLLPILISAIVLISHPPMPSDIFQTKHRTQTIAQMHKPLIHQSLVPFKPICHFLKHQKRFDGYGAEVAIHHLEIIFRAVLVSYNSRKSASKSM